MMENLQCIFFSGLLLKRKEVFCKIFAVAFIFLMSILPQAIFAADGIQFPKTIAWSAYPTGTGGYSQAVAIGNILQRQYSVNLRVILVETMFLV